MGILESNGFPCILDPENEPENTTARYEILLKGYLPLKHHWKKIDEIKDFVQDHLGRIENENGWVSKITFDHIRLCLGCLDIKPNPLSVYFFLRYIFDYEDIKYIYMYRGDLISQVISWDHAQQTRQFINVDREKLGDSYNYDYINLYNKLNDFESLHNFGNVISLLDVYNLCYEDLMREPDKYIKEIENHIQHPLNKIESKFKKMDAPSKEQSKNTFVEDFLRKNFPTAKEQKFLLNAYKEDLSRFIGQ